MKSRRRRQCASPRKLQIGKSYEKKLTGKARDAERKRNRTRKRRTNRTNTLKVRRRLLSRRPPLPFAN